jgi:hypothetical protein
MTPRAPLDPRLLEALSAYLDGKLEGADRSALEKRLAREEALRARLAELRMVRESLRSLPALKPPRPLTLSPSQAGSSARRPVAFASRRMAFASALAALAFVAVTSLDAFSRASHSGAAPAAAPAAESVKAADGVGAGPEETPPLLAAPKQTPRAPLPTVQSSREVATEAPSTPWEIPYPTEPPAEDECNGEPGAAEAEGRCGVPGQSEPSPTPELAATPVLHAAASFLEVFLGLSAVVLAVLAFAFRKRK